MSAKKRTFHTLIICLITAATIVLIRQTSNERIFKESRTSLYTIVTITVVAKSQEKAGTAIDAAYRELERLGRLLNFYADDSELTTINKNAGIKPVQVSAETLEIVKAAVYAGEQTAGGFDITLGPIIKLWDFNNKIMPTKEQVEEHLAFVGFGNIVVDEGASTVFLKKKGLQIDLGGIIKGYAADKAVALLKEHGIENGIVAVAGDIKTFGSQLDGKPWHLGIQNPRQKGNDDVLLATVDLTDKAISTSGDYQRFFIMEGVRYHHLINPKTGFPANHCRSVTVITESAALTDAFSTGIFIMGPEKGLEVLEKLGMDGIIVDRNGMALTTSGIKEKIHLLNRSDGE
jgi:thiamine biosynthesis lipoprotein